MLQQQIPAAPMGQQEKIQRVPPAVATATAISSAPPLTLQRVRALVNELPIHEQRTLLAELAQALQVGLPSQEHTPVVHAEAIPGRTPPSSPLSLPPSEAS